MRPWMVPIVVGLWVALFGGLGGVPDASPAERVFYVAGGVLFVALGVVLAFLGRERRLDG